MATNKPFIGGNFPPEIAKAIEDCFYANRFKSKAQVIEMILRAGMDALKDEYPELDLKVKLETGKKAEVDGIINERPEVHP